MADDRRYKDDEVRAIIDHALRAHSDESVTHQDLLAVGAGVGLSPADLERAIQELQQARLNHGATESVLRRRRRGVAAHAFVFLVVNACLFLINFLTTPGQWWVLFPMVVWGLGLLLHAGFALTRGVSSARLNREQRRLQRRPRPTGPIRIAQTATDGVTEAGMAANEDESLPTSAARRGS